MQPVSERQGKTAIIKTTCEGRPAWLLRTRRGAMLVSVGARGALLLDHWGAVSLSEQGDDFHPRPPRNRPSHRAFLDGVPLAYPVYGDPAFKEPCLAVVYADGTRVVQLAFRDDDIAEVRGRPALTLSFVDTAYGLVVAHR